MKYKIIVSPFIRFMGAITKKMIAKFTLGQNLKWNAAFRPASTGLYHALVVACGLTQIPSAPLIYNQFLPLVSVSSHRPPPMRDQDL